MQDKFRRGRARGIYGTPRFLAPLWVTVNMLESTLFPSRWFSSEFSRRSVSEAVVGPEPAVSGSPAVGWRSCWTGRSWLDRIAGDPSALGLAGRDLDTASDSADGGVRPMSRCSDSGLSVQVVVVEPAYRGV
jgi:hypothetical protein